MSIRMLAVIVVATLGLAWWLLGEDDESQVRNAHAALRELITRSDREDSLSVLEIRALQQMFADPSIVAGDGEGLVGTYSPDELAGLLIRTREIFSSIELSFGELEITFPAEDEALSAFTAALFARSDVAEVGEIDETRRVASRMRVVDGEWRFSEFRLASGPDVE